MILYRRVNKLFYWYWYGSDNMLWRLDHKGYPTYKALIVAIKKNPTTNPGWRTWVKMKGYYPLRPVA